MPKISVIIPVYNVGSYIRNMLLSVQQQSFDEFEAIIIDDGSDDNSIDIARQCVKNDSRFKIIQQQNSGVSTARNNGMDVASGKYIVFFDADDYIPVDALTNMYDCIEKMNCDMVVGAMKIYSDGLYSNNLASMKLSQKSHINSADINFIKTWSQCNKMYNLHFLRRNNIRFIDVKVAEDGHFLYHVLSKVDSICGCDNIVYHYMRRPFWQNDFSASMKVELNYLHDRITVYEDMLLYLEKIFAGKAEVDKRNYLDALLTRFISDSLINAFYRKLWCCDEETIDCLIKALRRYRNMISENGWSLIKEKQWDIPLERLVCSSQVKSLKKEIISEPLLSIILDNTLKQDELKTTMLSLYTQAFPSFEILINRKLFDKLESDIKNFPNITIIDDDDKNVYIRRAKGRYICIIDAPVIFNTNGFKILIQKMEADKELEFISAYMMGIGNLNGENRSYVLKLMDAVFGYGLRKQNRRKRINAIDNLFINKIFRTDAIKQFTFSGDGAKDSANIYNSMKFEQTRSTQVLAFSSDQELYNRAAYKSNKFVIGCSYLKNKSLQKFSGKGIRKKIISILKKFKKC